MNESDRRELDEMWTDTLVKIEQRSARRKMLIISSSLGTMIVALIVALIILDPGRNNVIEKVKASERDIILCDGTKVHLMENSSLEYPNDFTGSRREVKLIGEGYFEVTSSPEKPFIVKMDKGEIRVIGTKFLASAYPDKDVKVTLDEGVIELVLENEEPIIMNASQEVSYDIHEEKPVENHIVFKDERLEDIMISMSKIYGVQYSFENENMKDIRLSCRIPRYNDINQFLDLVDIVCHIDADLRNDSVVFSEKRR